jgi:hypothetical protein
MLENDFTDYLDVLGFEAAPYLLAGETLSSTEPTPEATLTPSKRPAQQPLKKLLILRAEHPSLPEADALLNKMIQAMGLSPQDIVIETLPALNQEKLTSLASQAQHVLNMLPQKIEVHHPQVSETHDPLECLKNPALKKPVWETLQSVMKSLDLAN